MAKTSATRSILITPLMWAHWTPHAGAERREPTESESPTPIDSGEYQLAKWREAMPPFFHSIRALWYIGVAV